MYLPVLDNPLFKFEEPTAHHVNKQQQQQQHNEHFDSHKTTGQEFII